MKKVIYYIVANILVSSSNGQKFNIEVKCGDGETNKLITTTLVSKHFTSEEKEFIYNNIKKITYEINSYGKKRCKNEYNWIPSKDGITLYKDTYENTIVGIIKGSSTNSYGDRDFIYNEFEIDVISSYWVEVHTPLHRRFKHVRDSIKLVQKYQDSINIINIIKKIDSLKLIQKIKWRQMFVQDSMEQAKILLINKHVRDSIKKEEEIILRKEEKIDKIENTLASIVFSILATIVMFTSF
jgi:hypothetical protein